MPSLEPISPTASYFDVLGVPVGAEDRQITERFRELSRLYHPDRWATADAETQTTALESTAFLNDAYRTLKDPFARAEYLLRRTRGVKMDDLKETQKPPQELFAQVFELQEALLEFQEARAEGDEATLVRLRPELQEAKTEFEAAYAKMTERLLALFARYDADDDREGVLTSIASILGTRGYLRRILTNLNATLS